MKFTSQIISDYLDNPTGLTDTKNQSPSLAGSRLPKKVKIASESTAAMLLQHQTAMMNSTGGMNDVASSATGSAAAVNRSILKQRLLANKAGHSSGFSQSMRGVTPTLPAASAPFAMAPIENRFRISKSTMKTHVRSNARDDIAVSRAPGGHVSVSKKRST